MEKPLTPETNHDRQVLRSKTKTTLHKYLLKAALKFWTGRLYRSEVCLSIRTILWQL